MCDFADQMRSKFVLLLMNCKANIAVCTIAIYKYNLPMLKESTLQVLTLLAKLRQFVRDTKPPFHNILSILTEPGSIFLSIRCNESSSTSTSLIKP